MEMCEIRTTMKPKWDIPDADFINRCCNNARIKLCNRVNDLLNHLGPNNDRCTNAEIAYIQNNVMGMLTRFEVMTHDFYVQEYPHWTMIWDDWDKLPIKVGYILTDLFDELRLKHDLGALGDTMYLKPAADISPRYEIYDPLRDELYVKEIDYGDK